MSLTIKRLLFIALAVLLLVALALGNRPGQSLSYQCQTNLALSQQEAWAVLSDISLAHHYVPGIVDTQVISEQRRGLGASREVYSSESRYIIETVTDWREGKGFTLQLLGSAEAAPAPFKRATFAYQLSEQGNAASQLNASLDFLLLGNALGEYLGKTLLAGEFQKRIDGVCQGFKVHAEQWPRASDS